MICDYQVSISLETVSPQADRVLSSAKLCIEDISTRKNKSLIESSSKICPGREPCGTPEIVSL